MNKIVVFILFLRRLIYAFMQNRYYIYLIPFLKLSRFETFSVYEWVYSNHEPLGISVVLLFHSLRVSSQFLQSGKNCCKLHREDVLCFQETRWFPCRRGYPWSFLQKALEKLSPCKNRPPPTAIFPYSARMKITPKASRCLQDNWASGCHSSIATRVRGSAL